MRCSGRAVLKIRMDTWRHAFNMLDFGVRYAEVPETIPPCGRAKVPRVTKLGTYWLCPKCDLSGAQ